MHGACTGFLPRAAAVHGAYMGVPPRETTMRRWRGGDIPGRRPARAHAVRPYVDATSVRPALGS